MCHSQVNNKEMIMKYRNLFISLMMMTGLFSQSIVGSVSDINSKPLEGANVIVVGTDLGAVSDKDGSYLVDVLPGEYNVIVSFIGYKSSTQSVVIGEDNVNVDFELTNCVIIFFNITHPFVLWVISKQCC